MTNAESENLHSRRQTSERWKRSIVAILSWAPALLAVAIAWYFIDSVQQSKLQLSNVEERLRIAQGQVSDADKERARLEKQQQHLSGDIATSKAKLEEIQRAIAEARSSPSKGDELIREVGAIASGAAQLWKQGKALEKSGDVEAAKEAYKASVAADPTYVRAYLSLGKLAEGKTTASAADLAAAASWYQEAARQAPMNGDIFENLAFLEVRRRNWPELIHVCMKLARLRPDTEALSRVIETLQSRDARLGCNTSQIPLAQYLGGLDAQNRGQLDQAIKLYSVACENRESDACYMLKKVQRPENKPKE
jgi:tetratricopeptide (TPR) repeat protein